MIRSDDESFDAFFDGRVTLYQSRSGYRFSLDALLLAHFVTVKIGARIVDLGTGNGVIALALATLHPSIEVTGIELQPSMVERARRNIAQNEMQSRIRIAHGDVRSPHQIAGGGVFDAAICNPPYRKSTSGRLSANRERQMARHEIAGGLAEFLGAGVFLLRASGRMAMVYDAVRGVDLLTSMRHAGLEPKRLRLVHSFAGAKASLVLVEAIKGGRSGVEVLPPLIVYQRDKTYSAEVASMIAGARRLSRALE
ncbi:MAG TPA: tRNA1(Val) (adenine(37)-N6)-methyltransferase [Candidatus Binatia bacterium]